MTEEKNRVIGIADLTRVLEVQVKETEKGLNFYEKINTDGTLDTQVNLCKGMILAYNNVINALSVMNK